MVTLEDLTQCYLKARSNKRRSKDAVRFEMNFEARLVSLWREINERKLKTNTNYAFVVFSPKAREIFATELRVRIVHHYLDWRLRPIYESVLSDRSFNNRKGMGLHAAISTFKNDVSDVSENYTQDAWIVHLDLKGYFPNADVEIALAQQLDLIEKHYEDDDKDDLKYMMTACMRADPARHCSIYVPMSNWSVVAPEKSLFNKPVGVGGAIGFLCWQNAMGCYINDVTKWLQSFDFMRVVVFVDDIYIVTKDKNRTLALMPELRERLGTLDVSLNEKKFYCQHCTKAFRVLGSRIKYGRETCDDAVIRRAMLGVEKLKGYGNALHHEIGRVQASVNTYAGMFKSKAMYGVLEEYRETVLSAFGRYMEWNKEKQCFALKPRFSFMNRLSRKYGVRL